MIDTVEAEQLYGVPSHLKAGGSIAGLPSRVFFLLLAAFVLGGGPALVLWNGEAELITCILVGVIPLLLLAPFMMFWLDPPPEHGLAQMLVWPLRRKHLAPRHIKSTSELRIENGVIFLGQHTECRAVFQLPTVNLDLASLGAHLRHIGTYGAFLDGLSAHHVQIVVRGIPMPRFDALRRMRLYKLPIARQVAEWLDQHYESQEAIDRPRYLIVAAPDPETLHDRVDSIERSLKQINLTPERLIDDDELRDLINDWWTWRPHPDRIGAERVVLHADCLELDGEFAQVYVLGKVPGMIRTNWWRTLLDGDLAADVTLNMNQISMWAARMQLDWRIRDLATSIMTPGRQIALDQAQKLRLSLEGSTRLWQSEILITVRGHDKASLQKRARRLKQQMIDMGAEVRLLRWEQLDGFEHASPLAPASFLWERPVTLETGTLARSTPLSASTMQIQGGVPFGFTGVAAVLFTLRRARRVLHMGWYGVPGAGKGFAVRMLLFRRHCAERLRLIMWDNDASHHEYSGRFCEFLGGVTLTPTSIDELKEMEIDPLWQVVALDATRLDAADIGEAFAIWKRKVEEHCLAFPGPTAFVVDEATDIAEHPDQRGAAALSHAVTHWRKFGIECHVITQRVSDWFATYTGGKVQGSLGAKWYGQMEPTELAKVAKDVGLSSEEQTRVLNAGVGQGLLVAWGRRVWVDLYEHASPAEYEAFHTDPPETAGLRRRVEVAA